MSPYNLRPQILSSCTFNVYIREGFHLSHLMSLYFFLDISKKVTSTKKQHCKLVYYHKNIIIYKNTLYPKHIEIDVKFVQTNIILHFNSTNTQKEKNHLVLF